MTALWDSVAQELDRKLAAMDEAQAQGQNVHLNRGQRDSLRALARRLPTHGAIVADEVGMGKTRIATELTETVVRCGGRVAILAPSGLGHQWQRELSDSKVATREVLRSVVGFGQRLVEDKDRLTHWSQTVTLVSHAFGKWLIKEKAHPVRWSLLPAIASVWHEDRSLRLNGGRWHKVKELGKHGEEHFKGALKAAQAITADQRASEWPFRACFAQFCSREGWASLMKPAKYGVGSAHRKWLHRVIGLGMGRFDLVVIDEAHKSRGDGSSLSLLLDEILWLDSSARRVAMTATPVELKPEQWIQSLGRIGVSASTGDGVSPIAGITKAIEAYEGALRNVRTQWRTSELARTEFAQAARQFQDALGRYVLRRDKSSDEAVMLFRKHGGKDYRDTTREIVIDTDGLDTPWKRALCAAESLSVIHVSEDQSSKRLRLTFASGHGSSAFMDGLGASPESAENDDTLEDLDAAKAELSPSSAKSGAADEQGGAGTKRKDRLVWWRRRLEASLREVPDSRFEHPAILACLKAIEKRTSNGDKVLVFGTYTEPMRTLVHLLNARQLLRSLKSGDYWPQSGFGVAKDADGAHFRDAVVVAYRQWRDEEGEPYPIHLDQLEATMNTQFEEESKRRDSFRRSLTAMLRQGLSAVSGGAPDRLTLRYLPMLERMEETVPVTDPAKEPPTTLVARALLAQTAGKAPDLPPEELALEFVVLVDATLDQDQQAADGNDSDSAAADSAEAHAVTTAQQWSIFCDRLESESARQMGEFARLMHGDTSPDSRRRMQLAFNRQKAYPMVVVAQSRVGREGLNLHQACSVVLLMHPEWNPAVVEQQIGRVDRVNSLWSRRLADAVASGKRGSELPKIEVLPVVFRGTYDEHQWRVLRDRWADLRAQLHGEVIPPALRPTDPTPEERSWLDELQRAAPRFAP